MSNVFAQKCALYISIEINIPGEDSIVALPDRLKSFPGEMRGKILITSSGHLTKYAFLRNESQIWLVKGAERELQPTCVFHAAKQVTRTVSQPTSAIKFALQILAIVDVCFMP